MTENKCLICNSPSPPPPTAITSNTLTHQLRAIFLLRNIFELPSWTLQKYLISSGRGENPSQWLSVCRECDHLVRKTRAFYEQFLEANRKFRMAKYELVRKMKESACSPSTFSAAAAPPGFTCTNCVRISDECRQFVKLHDYVEPLENPFPECDHRARKLLGAGVAHLNVKTEVFESTELENVADFYQHADMDLGYSHDLPLTPGHDYDDSEGGGVVFDYDDDPDDVGDTYLPPGPNCRKREAKAKSESFNTITKNDADPRSHEIAAAQASNLIQFLTTSHGKRMVHYDGHIFYKSPPTRKDGGCHSSGVTHFNCKRRRHGCPARIGLRNYNDEDATYTEFVPNLEAHDHSATPNGRDTTKHTIWYEVKALAKEIVKDNVNVPISQVFQMVQDSFVGDPEVTQELSKENLQTNLRSSIIYMKRKLGWKPGPGARRRFIGTTLVAVDSEGVGVTTQAKEEGHPEVKIDLIPSQMELEELTSAEASTLLQFLRTRRGKRMVRYDGHIFYKTPPTRKDDVCNSSGVLHFNCKWRRHGCPARIGLRNYSVEDGSYTSFIPNAAPHHHDESAAGSTFGDRSRKRTTPPNWHEVNALAKEIVKDNVNAPISQVFQMVQDSFLGDPEVTQELSKESAQNNLRKLIGNMKRKLGWKPEISRSSGQDGKGSME